MGLAVTPAKVVAEAKEVLEAKTGLVLEAKDLMVFSHQICREDLAAVAHVEEAQLALLEQMERTGQSALFGPVTPAHSLQLTLERHKEARYVC